MIITMSKPNENQANIQEGEVIAGENDFKQRAEKFQKEFAALCEKYQCQLVVTPQFIGTNHGTFEISLQQSIGQLPKKS